MLNKVGVLLLAVCPFFSSAQFAKPELKFPPSERFLYPVRPGSPGSLAGTMGELRNTHFHSGIDIRTDNIIGLPVLASKTGYISRASVSPSGYGNVLYITHPDGYTTLYAHLDKFSGRVAKHILQEQYKAKSATIDLFFQEGQFPVHQGDTIALSGNSGSSGGPHLHFDIRDPDNFALDPLKVETFSELTDNLPPALEKIALKTLDINSRINDRFGRFEFYAQRVGNNFILQNPILATGNIGVEILAKDRLAPKSRFFGGVNYIEMKVDSQLIFSQAIDKINIAETRGIYTLMDYKTLRRNGTRFYKLYVDDGNKLNFYEKSPANGKIKVAPGKKTSVKIIMKDSYGNASTVAFNLQHSAASKVARLLEPMRDSVDFDIQENVMVVSAKTCLSKDSNQAVVYSRGGRKIVQPDYANEFRSVFLLDLRKGFPDSIQLCSKTIVPNIKVAVPSGRSYKYYSDPLDIEFSEKALYDTMYLSVEHGMKNGREVFSIGPRTVPIDNSLLVTFRPKEKITWDKTHAVYRSAGRGFVYLGGGWENGGVQFATREFGEFTILQDTIAPTIRVLSINNAAVRFKIRDDLSGINDYQANINGEWLLMHFDSKSATIWSEKLDKSKPLKGDLTLTVTDNAGNSTTYTHKIL